MTTEGIQIKRIVTNLGRIRTCESCQKEFQLDEIRVEWRLRLQRSDIRQYLNGMFWTRQCESCFRTTVQMWINDLNSIFN